MLQLNPYLHFMGNTETALNFYRSVFGGEFSIFSRFGDVPGGEKMPVADQQKIMHVSLPVGKSNTIMATDMLESMGQSLIAGNNFHICIEAESEGEVDRLFGQLSAGGKVEMPLNKTFWGAYFGMCQDKFGIQWMINYTMKEKQ
jgi:PhnB protein